MPRILELATRVPEQRFSQEQVLSKLGELGLGGGRAARAIFQRSGVHYRHSVVDATYYTQERTTQDRNERYFAEALPLGEAAICACLDAAGRPPESIDDLIIVSCTGFDIPGLDLRLAGRLGMRPNLRRTNVLGMGCYGAFPGLLRAMEAVHSGTNRTALMLALELCSLHLQFDDTPDNIVSAALFADGAAAVLVENQNHVPALRQGPWIVDFATYCDYQTIDHMAFHVTDHGFRMQLSAYVPELLAANIETFVDELLKRNGLARSGIRFWGIHPGGRRILDTLQARLGLSDEQMAPSRGVLRDYGNMSSPTILFVLEAILLSAQPTPGDYGLLLGFGPGLTSEGILLRW